MLRCNQCRHLKPEEAQACCAFPDCPNKVAGATEEPVKDLPAEAPKAPGKKKGTRKRTTEKVLK